MAFQYDIDKIFEELEQKARNMQKQKEEKNIEDVENNPIESPEDAPKTQEVAPATSKTSENTHGGDEASKEIKDSPNSAEGGKITRKKIKARKHKTQELNSLAVKLIIKQYTLKKKKKMNILVQELQQIIKNGIQRKHQKN